MSKIITELEAKIPQKVQDKHQKVFGQQALYMGNGIYSIAGLYSTDTRELFLMFAAQQEGIQYAKA